MELTKFIHLLLSEGKVRIQGTMPAFTPPDREQAAVILEEYYQRDCFEMPYNAAGFSKDAALWAAEYFYIAVQLQQFLLQAFLCGTADNVHCPIRPPRLHLPGNLILFDVGIHAE